MSAAGHRPHVRGQALIRRRTGALIRIRASEQAHLVPCVLACLQTRVCMRQQSNLSCWRAHVHCYVSNNASLESAGLCAGRPGLNTSCMFLHSSVSNHKTRRRRGSDSTRAKQCSVSPEHHRVLKRAPQSMRLPSRPLLRPSPRAVRSQRTAYWTAPESATYTSP